MKQAPGRLPAKSRRLKPSCAHHIRVIACQRSLPGHFHGIEGHVSLVQEFFPACPLVRVNGETQGDRIRIVFALVAKSQLLPEEFFKNRPSLSHCRPLQKDGKFIPAVAANLAQLAEIVFQDLGKSLQRRVTCITAIEVIDVLEVIDVDQGTN